MRLGMRKMTMRTSVIQSRARPINRGLGSTPTKITEAISMGRAKRRTKIMRIKDKVNRAEIITVPSVLSVRSLREFPSRRPNTCSSLKSRQIASVREPWLPVALV